MSNMQSQCGGSGISAVVDEQNARVSNINRLQTRLLDVHEFCYFQNAPAENQATGY
jgi:hypothetical protein